MCGDGRTETPPHRRRNLILGIWELFVLAVGLSMDAFAVSICKGLSVMELKPKHALITRICSRVYRSNDFPPLCRRCQNRKCVWIEI